MTVVSAMEYLHRDHLGSVEAVTDAGGDSLLVQAYDPFGERRKSDWTGMLSASERQTLVDNQPLKTSRGYTGHEHLDRTGFIHMNGRLYDPQLGRFLSPDPIVAAPGSSQSWNSYSYVSNSPLSFVDPGGQFQAGIGCNVGYVMCMNSGGNTSGGGGGGSGHGTETVTVRTFNVHIGVNFARVPFLRDPFGSVFGRGGGINDDPNGGINSDVYFGGLPSFRLIFNFFISITSNTETRQIQTTEEEQSPASRPMGAGGQKGNGVLSVDADGVPTFDKSHPDFHSYYGSNFCAKSTAGCTFAKAVEGLLRYPASGASGTPIADEQTGFAVPVGTVRHEVYDGGATVINVTLKGKHLLHPGIVRRWVTQSANRVTIHTYGEGTGALPRLNEYLSDGLWKGVDQNIFNYMSQ